jgi:hypothetical protein
MPRTSFVIGQGLMRIAAFGPLNVVLLERTVVGIAESPVQRSWATKARKTPSAKDRPDAVRTLGPL